MPRYRAVLLTVVVALSSGSVRAQELPPASYAVRLLQVSPPKLEVKAQVTIDGTSLRMEQTRPAEVRGVGTAGWPALIQDLRVTDPQGRAHPVQPNGPAGWELQEPYRGPATLTYVVDYSSLAAEGWLAPREAALADADHFVLVGRSLFITAAPAQRYRVRFKLPRGWHTVAPWIKPAGGEAFEAKDAADLGTNLIVLTRKKPAVTQTADFAVSTVSLGHWRGADREIRKLLAGVIPFYVGMMASGRAGAYLVVLLPQSDTGGESYRNSFAFNVSAAPTAENVADWGHTIAHEVFHHWNGWRLRGADYASSQWCQEGFTEYFADRALLAAGVLTPQQFRQRLAAYIAESRKLSTPMARIGTHKGPPLYSAGALVAFAWDIRIRKATSNRKELGSAFRSLWQATDEGLHRYAWADIRAALQATAPGDWQGFYETYIDGTAKLPVDTILREVGLQVLEAADGAITLEQDPQASAEAKQLWQQVTGP